MTNKAVFFDKDGVLNIDNGIEDNLDFTNPFPWSGDIVAGLRKKGFKIFVVTNQPVVARGLITERELINKLERFKELIRIQNSDAIIDKIYYCPHHPNADLEEYRKSCECRKPKPGMLIRASNEYNVDLSKSFMVGDRISDIIAGHLAGCTTLHFLSGRHNDKEIESDLVLDKEIKPDFVISDINELKDIIL